MKMFTASLLTLVFALGTSSQEPKHAPGTNLDGTFWAVMDATSRGAYVLGFTAGYFRGYVNATVDSKGIEGARAAGSKDMNKAFLGGPASYSVGDIEKQVDLFYSNYANTPICMGDAVMAVYRSQAGEAVSEQFLINTRKTDAGTCHWTTN
jgi:hypothetical protein